MKRTTQELIDKFREVVASQSEDGIAEYLEDLNDSMEQPNLEDYVERKDYDAVVLERDSAISKANDYRDRYINRFYQPGNNTNDITIVQGGAKQLEIEKEEKAITYADLFE